MDPQLLEDAFVARAIDDAVAPFAGLLLVEDRDWLRGQILALLEQDEQLGRLLRAAHPRSVDASGEQLQPLVPAERDDGVGHG
jgi:hypothetical protein